jgi:surfeit locus 1 family protein
MPRLMVGIALALGGLAVLISLGVWQTQRLAWKEAILADIAARIAAPPIALPERPDEGTDRWRSVRLEGAFDAREIPVLASRKGEGAGFRLVAAFQTADGRRILIDRGFVRESAHAALPPASGPAVVSGNLHWPDEKDSHTPPPDAARGIWFARDLGPMAIALSTEPVLLVARNISPVQTGVQPWPVDASSIPNNHLQYAVTWFGLAIVWAGMTLLFIRRNWRKNG